LQNFREAVEELVSEGLFDKNKVDAAVAVFSESVTKGVEDTMTVVKQFEDTIEGSLEGAFTDFFDKTSEGFMNMRTLFKKCCRFNNTGSFKTSSY
jgi:formaldehyde-activating enzyme involved in methanogenesis